LQISNSLTKNWNKYGSQTPEKPGSIATFPGSMEVQAHFVANNTNAGLELIRRQWGYMLNHPASTNSTFWEGFLDDGSFDYKGTYMSHAHGWATGPTSALTTYVLGLQVENGGKVWSFIPQVGDLIHAQGQLTTMMGVLKGKWSYNQTSYGFTASVEAPMGTIGRVGIPSVSSDVHISVNGKDVWEGKGIEYQVHWDDDGYIYLENVVGGFYVITLEVLRK
jgi:hypothetical protein